MYDVIIIGRGPAGLSCAIYLSRANKKVLVIGKENKIWKKEVIINNYFALGETNGKKLMEKGENQAAGFGAKIVDSIVTKLETSEKYFTVIADKTYKCKNLLLATGSDIKKPVISNEADFVGKGVSYCVACDGFFFKNKKVFVVGEKKFALTEAKDLQNYTKDVTIVTNGKKAEFGKTKIKVETFKIEKILGEKMVSGVKTNKGELKVDGLFIASGDAGSNDLAKMLGLELDGKDIKVNKDMMTNVPFVWAAGDCTPGLNQISTAVGKGATAATNILKEGRR